MLFYDIFNMSLHKQGEELCGDKVKISKGNGKMVVVLSDGLGSGVKANILATLTSEIVNTMLINDISLEEVMDAMVRTLPVCKIRKLAYATFTILQIDQKKNTYKVINADNPPILHLRNGKIHKPIRNKIKIMDKDVIVFEGTLHEGDFLAMISDGLMYAGLGKTLNFGWGWDQIALFLEKISEGGILSAQDVCAKVIGKTKELYDDNIGDDATFIGVNLRQRRKLVLFTGPPLDRKKDKSCSHAFMHEDGVKVICGGTTANIVARQLNKTIKTDISSMTSDCPPVGEMEGIDLVTEGIVTISKVVEKLKQNDINYVYSKDGVNSLLRYLMNADYIKILVGQTINPFYQNPLLPKNVSIRLNLINKLSDILKAMHKDVEIILC